MSAETYSRRQQREAKERLDREGGHRSPAQRFGDKGSGFDHGSLLVKLGAPFAQILAPSAVRADDTDAVGRIGLGVAATGVVGVVGLAVWWWR